MSCAWATVKPDYLAFTVGNDTPIHEIMRFLGFKFRELGFGRYGYHSGFVSEDPGFEIYSDGHRPEMGIHVRISGQGCRLLEEDPFFEWPDCLSTLISQYSAKFTRTDIAIDDENFTVDYATVAEAVKNGTCARRGDSYEERHSTKHGVTSSTLYIGSRQSTAMLRVYTKGIQLGESLPWLRFEAEFKAERAHEWVLLLLSQGWDAAIGAIRHCWEFKDPQHKVVTKSRQRVASWWAEIIGKAKHVFKLPAGPPPSVDRLMTWVEKQLSTTIAVMNRGFQGSLEWLIDVDRIGERKMNEKHRRMIRAMEGQKWLAFG